MQVALPPNVPGLLAVKGIVIVNVKPAPAMITIISCAIAAILVISEVVALVEITVSEEQLLATATPVPQPINGDIVGTGTVDLPSAGIYETLPYAILLKIPDDVDVGDNCVDVVNQPGRLPQMLMPVQHPELHLIPAPRYLRK